MAEKKRKREADSSSESKPVVDIDVMTTKKDHKKAREKRRKDRLALMDKVPKVDENGIAYTKQQLRRMRKRLSRGLDPIETSAEKHARMLREAELRKEEEAELAGLVIQEEEEGDDDDDNNNKRIGEQLTQEDEGDVNADQGHYDKERKPDGAANPVVDDDDEKDAVKAVAQPAPKRKKRSKPVPDDYVCSACQNKAQPRHWIYDCPSKKTVRGTNQVSKKKRGLQDPSDCKLFVSGLPFDTTSKDVSKLFRDKAGVTVKDCRLVKFPDSGRCKGQAFLSFESADDAKKAFKMNGAVIPNTFISKTKEESSNNNKRKELKLKVTKVLSRFATKHKT